MLRILLSRSFGRSVGKVCISAGLALLLSGHGSAANLVSLTANDVPIRKILEELSRQSGLVVVSSQALDETTSAAFSDLSVSEAVKRLLRGRSYVLFQNLDGDERGELWVLDRQSGSTASAWRYESSGRPAAAERANPISELAEGELADALRDGNFAERQAAAAASGRWDDLSQALHDPQPNVRKAAIETLSDIGGPASIDRLAGLISDPDRSVRARVVDALGDIGSVAASPYLEQMTTDVDPYIRAAAYDYLAELGD